MFIYILGNKTISGTILELVLNGGTGSKPGQVHFKEFWALALAWIEKKLILIWYIFYNFYWSEYEIYTKHADKNWFPLIYQKEWFVI